MEKKCRTCKWLQNRKCQNHEMRLEADYIESIVHDIFVDIAVDAKEPIAKYIFETVEKVVLERVVDVKFTPHDYDEFYCKYYE